MPDTSHGIIVGDDGTHRCWWCAGDELYRAYHDKEWGFPVAEDRRLFEKLCLEGFQAGLSWLTILRKRENFRQAFDGFDFERVAEYDESDVERLMGDAGIVRNRQKIEATINNARRTLEVVEEFGSLASFVWQFEPGQDERPERVTRQILSEQTTSPNSKRLAMERHKASPFFPADPLRGRHLVLVSHIAQILEIIEVLGPPRSSLIVQEVAEMDDGYCDILVLDLLEHAVLPGRLEVDPGDFVEEVDAVGRQSKLEDETRFQEVIGARKARDTIAKKLREGPVEASDVLLAGTEEEVHVTGRAGVTVVIDGDAADQQKVHLVLVEQFE